MLSSQSLTTLSTVLLLLLCACSQQKQLSSLNDNNAAPLFQSGDRFSCTDDVASQELVGEILDSGDKSGLVRIRSSQWNNFYGPEAVVARTTDEGFEFTMLEDGRIVEGFVIHTDTAELGAGSGYYYDGGDSRGIDCMKLAPTSPLPAYTVKDDIHLTNTVANPNGSQPTYISLAVPFSPANELKNDIEKTTGLRLIDRGEAHITVVTPIEMQALRTKLSLASVLSLFAVDTVQEETFRTVCVGRGDLQQGNKTLSTFYVVVKSRQLFERRARLAQAFLQAGGSHNSFKANHYFPHITLGFTDRDLHENDGVIKDAGSCAATLQLAN
jgi:hypothetical protein